MKWRTGFRMRRRMLVTRGASPPTTTRRPLAQRMVLSFGVLVFVLGGFLSGCLALSFTALWLSQQSNPVSEIIRSSAPSLTEPIASVLGPQPTPSSEDDLPVWTGQDRITILLLGIDSRPDEMGQPTRSDTMILFTIDPRTKRAGLLSIPRDLIVPIPGVGENKINTAHFFGEQQRTGFGPQLAKRTIEYNFGVRVNYFARVDFQGFEQLVNAIDGVTVDVPRPIKDDEYPDSDYGIIRIYIPSGVQHMDGKTALQYARSRHSDNDFGRLQRQQQVLLAARDQALRLSLIPRIPQLLSILGDSVYTDIPATDMLPLAGLAREIESKDIVNRTIDSTFVIDPDGSGTRLYPRREAIRDLIDEIFAEPTPTPTPPTPTAEPTQTAPARTATPAGRSQGYVVQVVNGTDRNLYAAMTARWLESSGFVTTPVSQASRDDYDETIIYDVRNNRAIALEIANLLEVPPSAIRSGRPSNLHDGADFMIVLGFDAVYPVPDE